MRWIQRWWRRLGLSGLLTSALLLTTAGRAERIPVDSATRPLPGSAAGEWPHNDLMGERGLMGDVARDPQGRCRFEWLAAEHRIRLDVVQQPAAGWAWGGVWHTLSGPRAARRSVAAEGLWHPVIPAVSQPRLVGLELHVAASVLPAGTRPVMRLEVKGDGPDGREEALASREFGLAAGHVPSVLRLDLDPQGAGRVAVVAWILDHAAIGTRIDVSGFLLDVAVPPLSRSQEQVLFPMAALLECYDDGSGMAADRSNVTPGRFENVTATAKTAKVLALASCLQPAPVERARAEAMIRRSADALLQRLPRGPAGTNTLWPHFTRDGGREAAAGAEWASGDTAYAALDLLLALAIVGDRERVGRVVQFIETVDWAALRNPDGSVAHGYAPDGRRLGGSWGGFGAETLGVLLCARMAGVDGNMRPPPTDNGSGFIAQGCYPLPGAATDRWGNDWSAMRRAESAAQIGWYRQTDHTSAFFADHGLFGLSAAEAPSGTGYCAYGTGGASGVPCFRTAAGLDVVTPHYAGLVAAVAPLDVTRMWSSLRRLGFFTPLSVAESIAADERGTVQVNRLKGSWNLALMAEGFLLADPRVQATATEAAGRVDPFRQAWQWFFPEARR